MTPNPALLVTLLIGLALTSPAYANDSEAEIAVGGLALIESKDISLDKEDLYLSQEEVRVRYEFSNTSSKDITALVAFPLPDLPTGEQEAGQMVDYRQRMNFTTTVDGKPVQLNIVEQSFLNGKDISESLRAAGIPLNSDHPDFDEIINRMDDPARQVLVKDGVIIEEGSDGNPIWGPRWTLRTTVTRKQTFPANSTIKVEHRYVPIVGGSVAGALEPQYRHEWWSKSQVRKYCIEKSWLRAFDKMREQRRRKGSDQPAGYSETWLGYVLSSGANWKGPIKTFRLVVDKGKPESLVSFCADGVKKISPTEFEIRKTNYEPHADINVLFINWAEP
jgi:hypothetical protein